MKTQESVMPPTKFGQCKQIPCRHLGCFFIHGYLRSWRIIVRIRMCEFEKGLSDFLVIRELKIKRRLIGEV